MRRVILSLALTVLAAADAAACTTFCARNVFGRNYDFETGEGMVLVNKRGLQKTSMTASGTGASWTSQYGSVTFNQFGRDFPMDGMNEAGLVVALMWLDGTRYPDPDERPSLGVLEWIQYQLDTAASVDAVIDSAQKVRIRSGGTPLHYLISDHTGAVATIEFLGGAQVVHRGDTLPIPVLTNNTYASSLAFYNQVKAQGVTPWSASSLDRFARAALMLQTTTASPVETTLSILSAVAQPGATRWSVAYDTMNRTVHYRSQNNAQQRSLDMKVLDLRCTHPTLMLPLDLGSGDVLGLLQRYEYEANRELIGASYAHTSFLAATSQSTLDATARHPETAICQPTHRRRSVR